MCGIRLPGKEIDYRIDVYEAQINDLKQVLQSIEDTASSVLLIGHNPGMSYFADHLANCGHINLPTAGMIYMHLDIKTWKELKPGAANLLNLIFLNVTRLIPTDGIRVSNT